MTTIDIDVDDRWDAVQLLKRLAAFQPHLVQLQHPAGRWLVRAHTPGTHGEGLVGAVDAIDEWSRERHISSVGVCLSGTRPLLEAELRRALRAKAAKAQARG
jgi:hypothetical protein